MRETLKKGVKIEVLRKQDLERLKYLKKKPTLTREEKEEYLRLKRLYLEILSDLRALIRRRK